jgi:DNA-directed RNA polymerase specialized sigma24 family protein
MTPVDPYVLQQASCRASLLVATAGFTRDDWEDVRQEMVFDCLRRARKFDSSRGEWGGFVRGVMRNQAVALVSRRCRRTRHEVLAADLARPDGDAELVEAFWRQDPRNDFDVSIDVRRVLQELPIHLQHLAHLLTELSVQEAGLAIGKSRSRVYQMTRQLRDAFVQAGFRRPGCPRKSAAGQ